MDSNGSRNALLMTRHQLQAELLRCEYCEEKPCTRACPSNCSPFDFIMAARVGESSDIRRAAAEIMRNNPLGGVCGLVCPDRFCMAACSRKTFDRSIDIPRVQATLVAEAKELGGIPPFAVPAPNGKKVAVIGGGPAGLGAAAALAQMGYAVEIFESRGELGGMLNLIPEHRLDRGVIRSDIDFLLSLGSIQAKTGVTVQDPKQLLGQGYDAVCVSTGLWKPIELGIENEALAIRMADLLATPEAYDFHGAVAIVGGGATAVDCAITARQRGASRVELFMLERLSEMPLTNAERQELVDFDIEVNGRIRLTRIDTDGQGITRIGTKKVRLPENLPFKPANMMDVEGT
ncbi:MAG: FAD-dependent oxidoreductase, partial [Bacteroidota bacterium]